MQDALFARIQAGEYHFPAEDWDAVSAPAKDLIRRLLVKDARQRYTAEQVLAHPFLATPAPTTPLSTPDVLLRNDSKRDLAQIQENFQALSRVPLHIGGSPPGPAAAVVGGGGPSPTFLQPSAGPPSRKNSGLFLNPVGGIAPGVLGTESPPTLVGRCSAAGTQPLQERLSNSSDNGLVVGAV